MVFLNHSQATESLRKTICPTWDQTLVFDTVEIHGDPQSVYDNPPKIIVEIFDYDSFVSCYCSAILCVVDSEYIRFDTIGEIGKFAV